MATMCHLAGLLVSKLPRFSTVPTNSTRVRGGAAGAAQCLWKGWSLEEKLIVHLNKMNISQTLSTLSFLLVATILEVNGDAFVRIAIYNHVGVTRLPLMLAGAGLLLGYGFSLNLAPVEFRHVVGLYVATLFVIWQVINFLIFRTLPNLPILVGGMLIVAGGLIVTFWKPIHST